MGSQDSGVRVALIVPETLESSMKLVRGELCVGGSTAVGWHILVFL